MADVLYICDLKACQNCSFPECRHTTNIEHAVNFSRRFDYYEEIGTNWISIEDSTKPRHLQECFISYVFDGYDKMRFYGVARYYAFGDGNGYVNYPHFANEGVDGMRVTHWMEIPRLPNGQ